MNSAINKEEDPSFDQRFYDNDGSMIEIIKNTLALTI